MKKKIISLVVILAIIAGIYGYYVKRNSQQGEYPPFVSGNGRLEATEVFVSTRDAGRIQEILVNEGDLVQPEQVLVWMSQTALNAQMLQAKAGLAEAKAEELNAEARVAVCESDVAAAKSTSRQKEMQMNSAKKRFDRTAELFKKGVATAQEYDDEEGVFLAAQAEFEATKAKIQSAEAEYKVALTNVESAKAMIQSAEANIAVIQEGLDSTVLTAPRRGRVEYRIAQPGEVLSAGGRVLNLSDLTDVYMTFFLPEAMAGQVEIGAEVRIVLDAIPDYPVPAEISYVSSVAQFTPKTVETQIERQKMMFRVKARIRPELLEKYIDYVKTGLPGVAWVRLDKNAKWPEELLSRADREEAGIPEKNPKNID